MEAFEKFVQSDAFFPVLLALLIILFVSLIAIILLNRKNYKQATTSNTNNDQLLDKSDIDNKIDTGTVNNELDSIIKNNDQEELTNSLMSLEDEDLNVEDKEITNPFENNNFDIIEPVNENEMESNNQIISENEKTIEEEIEDYINNFFETKVKSR